MKRIIIIICLIIIVGGIGYGLYFLLNDSESENVQLPNPASVYCLDNGGELKNIMTEQGSKGYCIFLDGRTCGQWDFFRTGKCIVDDEPIYSSSEECQSVCKEIDYENGGCMWSQEAGESYLDFGYCYIEGSRHCGDSGSCHCYCY
ncbi:MAG: DUF333 domain-containing protein [bacterium]